jgi:DNA polymerase (family 10)
MPVHNSDVSEIFGQVADLLEIQGANPFRVRAYRAAARTVGSISQNVSDLISQGQDLSKYAGIGKDLAGKIEEIVKTGKLSLLEDIKQEIPGELSELTHIAGLGAKRVAAIYEQLNVTGLADLEKAANDHKIRQLEGFGQKTEESILQEIQSQQEEHAERTKLVVVEEVARPLIEYLKKTKGVKDIEAAGSYRRRRETVRDLDILATCKKGADVMDRFVNYEDVQKVVSKGKTRSTVILRSGFQVDLRVVPQVSYGAALHYFTGSKEHNIAIRKMGVKKKLKVNEYGVFKGDKRIAGRNEKDVFDKVGLPFIEPELRENCGEIEAAQKDKLPKLVAPDDIKGDLHVHTKYTDGHYTIQEMAEAAKKRGYKYLAIADHSKHVTVAHGLKAKDLRKQMDEIDKVNEKLKGITVLKATEVDILEDGSLDLPDSVLKELDLTVCSVHYKFNLSKKKQTDRIIKAMDNPYFAILAHPTGRLINERRPYEIDMEKIIKKAKDSGCFLELNAHPDRLDLNDIDAKRAKEVGVKVVISTDAHRIDDLDYMRFGLGQARRGWLEPDDVLNTRGISDLKKLLKRKK